MMRWGLVIWWGGGLWAREGGREGREGREREGVHCELPYENLPVVYGRDLVFLSISSSQSLPFPHPSLALQPLPFI